MTAARARWSEEGIWVLAAAAVRRTFVFSGRARRTEALHYYVSMLLVGLMVIVGLIAGRSLFGWSGEALERVFSLLVAVLAVPMPALLIRRGHDIGLPAWLSLSLLIALAVADYWLGERTIAEALMRALQGLLFLGCLVPNRPAADRFGPDPRLGR